MAISKEILIQYADLQQERKETREKITKLEEQIVKLEKQIYEMTGEEFNINSPKQLAVVLFEHLGLPNLSHSSYVSTIL